MFCRIEGEERLAHLKKNSEPDCPYHLVVHQGIEFDGIHLKIFRSESGLTVILSQNQSHWAFATPATPPFFSRN